ncbi:MAG TPA: thiamine pyrophosphate-dependent enzyme [Acidobacteriota bacterium]
MQTQPIAIGVVERAPLTKKELAADHPTWCAGCGDFSVLSQYFKLIEGEKLLHERFVSIAGIGCSSRFPYFVNAHGAHFLHGRALTFASGVSLTRPDLHVFVFGGDGDAFSIGGNHLDHTARKNIRITYVIMDNFIYGLTKAQTSPTTPLGTKSKTDPTGSIDRPINPMKKLLAGGATFVGRTYTYNSQHSAEMLRRAALHDGFSVVECLSECTEFFKGSFDGANPKKGGTFKLIEEKKHDGSPEDELRHDPTDEVAAYRLAQEHFPGWFGVFYEAQRVKTKNQAEAELIEGARQRSGSAAPVELLQKTFDRFK